MSQVVDLEREWQDLPISPAIRHDIETMRPEADRLLAAEAERQGKDIASFLAVSRILFAGFLMALDNGRQNKPVSEVFQDFLRIYYPDAARPVLPQPSGEIKAPVTSGHRPHRPYDPAALIAALDSFEQGDPQEQKETLEYLMTALDRDRPGQRRVFGEGTNPILVPDESS